MERMNLQRITLLCLICIITLLLIIPSTACSASRARSAVETQLRINRQVAEWHTLIDSVIQQLAAGSMTEEQAMASLEAQITETEGNVKLLELWQNMQGKIQSGEPLLAVLIDASSIVGVLSQRYQLALEQLEADLANAEDDQDATLFIIGAGITALTGVPVAGLFSSFTSKRARRAGHLEGRAKGIDDGAFYGAAKVASALAAGRKADPTLLGTLHDDTKPATLRVKAAIEADSVVERAVRGYKESESPPVRPV